jgi:tetratricopeptide (TPR) repeat protein
MPPAAWAPALFRRIRQSRHLRLGALAFAGLALASCASGPLPPGERPASSAAADPRGAPAPAALPFIEDDYDRALAEARAAHKPLFVDAWAPWCHSCLSMRAYTFREAKVRAHAGDFVWASIDTENAKNAAWVETHPTHAMPTLFVVDPATGGNVLEWPSSATADELVQLLDEARTAMVKGHMEWQGAATQLEAALDAMKQKKDFAGCAEKADRELPQVKAGGGRAATIAVECAASLPAGDARRGLLDRAIERARKMAADRSDPMLPDDRSGLYEAVVDVLDEDGRTADAKEAARPWAAFLEDEAKRAPDPAARMVFDAHRLNAYVALGEPERALPMLEASARDFPGDYNPPARMAVAYLAMKRTDEALAAIDRSLALAYGPRTLRLLATKSDVLVARGDRAGAAAVLKDAIARAKGMTLTARYKPFLAELEQRARALDASR